MVTKNFGFKLEVVQSAGFVGRGKEEYSKSNMYKTELTPAQILAHFSAGLRRNLHRKLFRIF